MPRKERFVRIVVATFAVMPPELEPWLIAVAVDAAGLKGRAAESAFLSEMDARGYELEEDAPPVLN